MQVLFKQNNKIEGHILPYVIIYYKTTIIKTVQCRLNIDKHKNIKMEQN